MYRLTTARRNTSPFEGLFQEFFGTVSGWVPHLDVAETPESYIVRLDLPGVDPAELEITVVEDRLDVRGERKSEGNEEGARHRRVERRVGAFSRAVQLPGAVDSAQVVAEATHGVLTITLPKQEAAKSRRVKVSVN